jgi:hypothetical protein
MVKSSIRNCGLRHSEGNSRIGNNLALTSQIVLPFRHAGYLTSHSPFKESLNGREIKLKEDSKEHLKTFGCIPEASFNPVTTDTQMLR